MQKLEQIPTVNIVNVPSVVAASRNGATLSRSKTVDLSLRQRNSRIQIQPTRIQNTMYSWFIFRRRGLKNKFLLAQVLGYNPINEPIAFYLIITLS